VARNNVAAKEHVKRTDGTWQRGDTFYLMSDALAAWFLRYSNLPGADAVYCLKQLENQTGFATFIELQRKDMVDSESPMLRNDDVTLLVCTIV
jgi:hypothetical protein